MSSGKDLLGRTARTAPVFHAAFIWYRGCTADQVTRSEELMRRSVLLFVAALALSPVRADALTVRDILELSRAGLGEEILLALIDVDRSVFPIDTATLKSLKEAGVSERVILAIVRSARTPQPALAEPAIETGAPPRQQEPQVIVIEHHHPPQVREVHVAVPVPVYIPVGRRSHHVDDTTGRHPENEHGKATDKPAKPAEPVYWGWGGKLRPDAWKPK